MKILSFYKNFFHSEAGGHNKRTLGYLSGNKLVHLTSPASWPFNPFHSTTIDPQQRALTTKIPFRPQNSPKWPANKGASKRPAGKKSVTETVGNLFGPDSRPFEWHPIERNWGPFFLVSGGWEGSGLRAVATTITTIITCPKQGKIKGRRNFYGKHSERYRNQYKSAGTKDTTQLGIQIHICRMCGSALRLPGTEVYYQNGNVGYGYNQTSSCEILKILKSVGIIALFI